MPVLLFKWESISENIYTQVFYIITHRIVLKISSIHTLNFIPIYVAKIPNKVDRFSVLNSKIVP